MHEFLRQTARDYDMPLEMVVSIYKKCSNRLELYDRLEEELKTTHNSDYQNIKTSDSRKRCAKLRGKNGM